MTKLDVREAEFRANGLQEHSTMARDFLLLLDLARRRSALLKLVLHGEHTDEMVLAALAEDREAGLEKVIER